MEVLVERAYSRNALNHCFAADLAKFVRRPPFIKSGKVPKQRFAMVRQEKIVDFHVAERLRLLKCTKNCGCTHDYIRIDHVLSSPSGQAAKNRTFPAGDVRPVCR